MLTQQTGVRFIFDDAVKQERLVTLVAERLPVAAAMDLVLVQLQLARQVLSDNMVVVYPNTLEKQRDYQQQMVQTFYLTNIDPRKAAEMLRTLLNVRTLYVDDVSSAVLIRDTPETIEMARRLLSSLDVPEAEVMMELEVLEISRGRLEQLGIRYPELVTVTPTALAGQALVMADMQYQNSSTLQLSNVPLTVDFKRVLSNSNLLASPRIRARNHEKARILIGTRVPVITNTVTATSLQPVVTGSVQYVDAGLTLDVEPTIYRDGDVSMRINLEVSSIIKEVTSAISPCWGDCSVPRRRTGKRPRLCCRLRHALSGPFAAWSIPQPPSGTAWKTAWVVGPRCSCRWKFSRCPSRCPCHR